MFSFSVSPSQSTSQNSEQQVADSSNYSGQTLSRGTKGFIEYAKLLGLIQPQVNVTKTEVSAPPRIFSTKAVIFDCDGTLVDSDSILYPAAQEAFRKQGYDLKADEFWEFIYKNSVLGSPKTHLLIGQFACKLLARNCEDEIIKDIDMYYDMIRKKGFPPIEATVRFVHQLAKEKLSLGIKIGLASGNSRANILQNLRDLEIEQHFDAIVSGHEDLSDYRDPEGTNKPKPYVYLHAAKKLGFLPEECVAIEDSKTGITSAVDAGLIAVAVPNACSKKQDLSHAHLKIESFSGMGSLEFLQTIDECKIKHKNNPRLTAIKAATTFRIVRHGQTDWNVEKRIQGQLPVTLNEVGRAQARESAKVLKEVAFDVCYSSDLPRAYETACIITQDRSLEVTQDPRLRERHRGKWQGRLETEFSAASDKEKQDVESDKAMSVRIFHFLHDTVQKHQGKNVLVVAHERVMSNIVRKVLSLDCIANDIGVKHTGVLEIAFSGIWTIKSMDGISLPETSSKKTELQGS